MLDERVELTSLLEEPKFDFKLAKWGYSCNQYNNLTINLHHNQVQKPPKIESMKESGVHMISDECYYRLKEQSKDPNLACL